MNRKQLTKTALTLGGVALGLGVASYYLTRKLTELAIVRSTPKAIKQIKSVVAGSGKMKDVSKMVEEAADVLRKTPHETVSILSYDGLELVGHFFPVDDAKRTIIAFHGWRSGWADDFGLIDSFWRSNGCQVLYVEQRGQNASGGDSIGFGLLERFDVASWAGYMAQREPDLPIYLCGVSMGATSVLMAANLELPEAVCGLMTDCGFTSPYAIWKHVTQENLHLPYDGVRAMIVNDICKQRLHMTADQYSTTTALRHTKLPVLFVHGSDDHFVPVSMTYENYQACAGEKELLIVPGADHGMSCLVEPQRYQNACLNFWNEHDA